MTAVIAALEAVAAVAALAALVVLRVGAGVGEPPSLAQSAVPLPPYVLAAEDVPYATGRALDILRPMYTRQSPPPPVVVLVHACCGDRADLGKLGEALAKAGAVVFNADWAGMDADGRYPAAYEEVACAVRYARATAAAHGGDPTRLTLLGWSDGTLAAAVVASIGDQLDRDRCRVRNRSALPDALVGVAGFYGWSSPPPPRYVNARTIRFLGGTPRTAARAWHDATPYSWLDVRPSLPVRLLVGAGDSLLADARRFATALERAGHPVRLVVAEPAGDPSMISPRTDEGHTTVRETLAALSR